MKHSPESWSMVGEGLILTDSREHSKAIGIFKGFASTEQHMIEHHHNNKLIIASPKLYRILHKIIECYEQDHPIDEYIEEGRELILEIDK